MHFSAFFALSLATIATALPQSGGFGHSRRSDFQPGYSNSQQPPAAETLSPVVKPAPTSVAAAATQKPSMVPPANNPSANISGGFDASLVPQFGITAGKQPDGTGNCVGNGDKLIPCACPPDRHLFIQKVAAAAASGNSEGVPVSFPTDNSVASQKARIGTSVIVLQNLNGKGVGCPAASTTFLDQQKALG